MKNLINNIKGFVKTKIVLGNTKNNMKRSERPPKFFGVDTDLFYKKRDV
jgi:hypothetical protein